ncbi:MAG TPA: hypothetical protein P5076_05775 [Myxococcota bacterium]|nr:hypothetical protein [Myxococcota bacterium]
MPRSATLAAILALLLLAGPSLAAEPALQQLTEENGSAPTVWRAAPGQAPRVVGGLGLWLPGRNAIERAQAFVAGHRELLLPGDERSELVVTRSVATPLGRVVQLEQRIQGLPVVGGSASLAFDPAGRLTSLILGARPAGAQRLDAALASPEAARDQAEAAFLGGGGLLRGPARIETVWLPGPEAFLKAHLVTLPASRPLADHTFIVAGPDARVLWAYQRSPMARGYAYPQNPTRGSWEEVELLYLTSLEHLSGEHVEVYNCTGSAAGSCTPVQLAAPDANGDYLIVPENENDPNLNSDLFVEVQGYYAINTVRDYFVGLGADPSPLKVGVNYPMRYTDGPNAFYSPQEASFQNGPAIMMGQWTTIDLAVDNDVIFHEYGHHVFGEFSQAGMFDMDPYGPVFWGLALNEATADYFSCAALEDPILGEYFASRLPQALPKGYLRIVDNDYTCPDGLYGEGHDDGMVWSGFLWEVRTLLGEAIVDPLYLDVIAAFPQDIDIPTATQTFLTRSALVLDATQQGQVQDIATRRGLPGCERFITLTPEGHTGLVIGKEMLGQYGNMVAFVPAELHYKAELPAEATALTVEWTVSVGTSDVELLVRADQPVQHSLGMAGLTSTYDFILEQGGTFDLTQAGGQFEPGHTYFFHPVNRAQPSTEYTISGEVAVPQPDGGPDGEDGGADGEDAGDDSGADGGADGGQDGECPEGQHPEVLDGQSVCAPDCRAGFTSEYRDGSWLCVGGSSGCAGAGAGATGLGLGLLGLLGLVCLGALRRRSSSR